MILQALFIMYMQMLCNMILYLVHNMSIWIAIPQCDTNHFDKELQEP